MYGYIQRAAAATDRPVTRVAVARRRRRRFLQVVNWSRRGAILIFIPTSRRGSALFRLRLSVAACSNAHDWLHTDTKNVEKKKEKKLLSFFGERE